jgi:hypothetical protein
MLTNQEKIDIIINKIDNLEKVIQSYIDNAEKLKDKYSLEDKLIICNTKMATLLASLEELGGVREGNI